MLKDAEYFRNQAALVRKLAGKEKKAEARNALIKIADIYERLCRKAEFFTAVAAKGDPEAHPCYRD